MILNVLSVSLSMSAVILGLYLIRKHINKRYSAKVMCMLWLFIALRMLVPVQIDLPVSRMNFDVNLDSTVTEVELPRMDTFEPEDNTIQLDQTISVEESVVPAVTFSISWQDVITCVWLAGVFFMVAKQGYAYISISKWLKRNSTYYTSSDGYDVYLSAVLPEPLSFGGIKSSIYLTETFKDDVWVLNHELTHCRHRDGLMMIIASLLKAIYWFNPLVYLLDKQWEADREMYCDEIVLNGKSSRERKEYMVTLYDAAEAMTQQRLRFTSGLLDGEHQMVERFRQIAANKLKKSGKLILVLSTALIVFVSSLVGCSASETGLLKEMMRKFDDPSLIKIVESKVYDVGINGLEYNSGKSGIQLYKYDADQLRRIPRIQTELNKIELLLEGSSEEDAETLEQRRLCLMEEIEQVIPVLNKKMEQNHQEIEQLIKKADFKKIDSFEVVADDSIEATIVIYLDEETQLGMKFFKSGQMYVTLGDGIRYQEKEIYRYNTEIISGFSELVEDYKYWKYTKEFWKNLIYSAPDWWMENYGL